MSDTITLTRQALARMLDGMYRPDPDGPDDPLGPLGRYHSRFSSAPWLAQTGLGRPADDDPGPWGPIGPIIRTIRQIEHRLLNPQPLPPNEMRTIQELVSRLQTVLLNPQPLPPRERFSEVLGPHPEPWRLAIVARSMIEHAVAQFGWAQVLAGDERAESSLRVIGRQLRETLDDWCGTPPGPRWPFPWPPPFIGLEPADLLLAGLQFQRAADAIGDHPLQGEFAAAADQLMRRALDRLENGNGAPEQMVSDG